MSSFIYLLAVEADNSSRIGENLSSLFELRASNVVLWLVVAGAVVFFAVAYLGAPIHRFHARRKRQREDRQNE